MSELKRLSPQQSRRVNALIRKECCNCFDGNCILLDDGESCVCPQLISYSLLCKWFRRRRSPIRQAAFCGALPERGQTALFRMRRRLCFHIKQCQILPRLQKVHYPQASRRAYEEKARPCYEVGAFRGFIFKGFQTRKSKGQGIYTFHPENAVLLRNKSIYRYP